VIAPTGWHRMLAELNTVFAGVPTRWGAVTTVAVPQRCASCGRAIRKGGTKKTGTLAYYCPERRMWNCVPCRQEAYALDALTGNPHGVYP